VAESSSGGAVVAESSSGGAVVAESLSGGAVVVVGVGVVVVVVVGVGVVVVVGSLQHMPQNSAKCVVWTWKVGLLGQRFMVLGLG
jgi:hypothetical protein